VKGGGKKMTNKLEDKKDRLKLRPKERLTCCNCKNQTFLLMYGCSDFPFFDLMCSKCGSGYPLVIGK
jgi:hypothetical protein